MKIATHAASVLDALDRAGYEAWVVGGCVRDTLMGRTPHDWDVATAALPGQVKAVLPWRTVDTGIAHGTVTVLVEGEAVEVTTYRVDGAYLDARRPSSVAFTPSLEEDLRRRDFTVNAIAARRDALFDPFGGREDIRAGIIRTVGAPEDRFGEDALRILRALRFSATLGFEIEAETGRAIQEQRESLECIANERIAAELTRLLAGKRAVDVLRRYYEVIAVFLPEILPSVGFNQNNRHHIYDVWVHTLHAIAAAPPDLDIRLCMLFHDLGKPQCYSVDAGGTGHFYGHGVAGAGICHKALRRLRFDNETIRRVESLVRYHDTDLLATPVSIRRWLGRMDADLLRKLIAVKRADNLAQAPLNREKEQRDLDRAEQVLERVLADRDAFSLKHLAVDGRDMLELGLSGSEIGRILEALLEEVIGGRCPNTREMLLDRAEYLTRL